MEVGTHLATVRSRRLRHRARAPLWPPDTALRPEGKDGAPCARLTPPGLPPQVGRLLRFQALLKARACAGDAAHEQGHYVAPMWERPGGRTSLSACAMRRRVEKESVLRGGVDRRIVRAWDCGTSSSPSKFPPARPRPPDESLRVRATLEASTLSAGGYVSRTDAAA